MSAKELLVLLHWNTALNFIAAIFFQLVRCTKLNATRMAAFNHQFFQVYFDFAGLLVRKIMFFSYEKVVFTQFDTGR